MYRITHFLQSLLIVLLSAAQPQPLLYTNESILNTTNVTNITIPTPTLPPVQIHNNSTNDNGASSNSTGGDIIDSNSTNSNFTDSNSTSSRSTNSSDVDINVTTIAPTPSSSNTSTNDSSNSSSIEPSLPPLSSIPSSIPSQAPTIKTSSLNSNYPTVIPTAPPSGSLLSSFPTVAPTPSDAVITPTTDDDNQYTTNPTNSPTIYMSSFDRYIFTTIFYDFFLFTKTFALQTMKGNLRP